jgi:hypothetical protein
MNHSEQEIMSKLARTSAIADSSFKKGLLKEVIKLTKKESKTNFMNYLRPALAGSLAILVILAFTTKLNTKLIDDTQKTIPQITLDPNSGITNWPNRVTNTAVGSDCYTDPSLSQLVVGKIGCEPIRYGTIDKALLGLSFKPFNLTTKVLDEEIEVIQATPIAPGEKNFELEVRYNSDKMSYSFFQSIKDLQGTYGLDKSSEQITINFNGHPQVAHYFKPSNGIDENLVTWESDPVLFWKSNGLNFSIFGRSTDPITPRLTKEQLITLAESAKLQ